MSRHAAYLSGMQNDAKWLRDMASWWRDFARLGPTRERQNRLDTARGFDALADKAEAARRE